ncbi:MAG: hypothetical protein ACREFJ_17710 [Acetobacteraceae bacterium]
MRLGERIKLNGDEWDAFHRRSRRIIAWAHGEVAAIKRAYRQRLRHRARQDLAPGKRGRLTEE